MLLDCEPKAVHQYCFSITNKDVVTTCVSKSGLQNVFQKHRLVIASRLPDILTKPLESWLENELRVHAIEIHNLRLDFVSESGLLNYALFANPQQQIINKLRKLDGFTSVDDITNE